MRVLAVCPGPTSTGFSQRAGLQPGQLAEGPRMTSEDVVMASWLALAAGRSVVIPGSYTKKFAAGEYGVGCALIIGKRKPSTDLKTSLNDALRDFNVSV